MNKMYKKEPLIKVCKICKSKKIKFIYKYQTQNYYMCIKCNLVFQNPLPTISFLKDYYSKEYFDLNYSKKQKK